MKVLFMVPRNSLVFFLVFIFSISLYGETISYWVIDANNPSDPLLFSYNGKTLHVLKGLGPVFRSDENSFSPVDYKTTIVGNSVDGDYRVIRCKAVEDDFAGEYTLKLRKLEDGAIELIAEGGKNVVSFQCGNIVGKDDHFKQFYMGDREIEPWLHNDNWPPMIYWSEGNLYFYGFWDADSTHAATYSHRLSPKKNFLAQSLPISCDSQYATLTDRSMPSLKERYVIRASADMWKAYNPVTQKPSQYAGELAEMMFNDVWDESFAANTFFLDWLKQVGADKVKCYTIIQQWGYLGFDDSNPDFYRRPDHTDPAPRYGTKQERDVLFNSAKSLGRFGVRFNYLAMLHPENSYSYQEKLFKKNLNSDGSEGQYNNIQSILPLLKRQDTEVHQDFNTSAVFHDQWSSGGSGFGCNNFDANSKGAGTLSATRQALREVCKAAKEIHQGPMSSETLNAEFLIGEFVDTGDFGIFAGEHRYDFAPEYKLRRLHKLTTTHSMGLGMRFFAAPWEEGWFKPPSWNSYFNDDEMLDNYRACEVLYGNGAYLFFYYDGIRMVHALTECFTVGVAQRYYTLQSVDYVKYGKGQRWKTFEKILKDANSTDEIYAWYKQFHIRYANGCHVWVNRDSQPLTVHTNDNRTFKLPKDGWLVYTEDGNLTAYTALCIDPVIAGNETRVDFCEDKSRGIRYANPRKATQFMGVGQPTVWFDGKVHYVLTTPEITFFKKYREGVEAKMTRLLVSEDFDKIKVNELPKLWSCWEGGTFARVVKSESNGNCLKLIDTSEMNSATREFYPTVMIPFVHDRNKVDIYTRPLNIKLKIKADSTGDGLNIFVANKSFTNGNFFATGRTSGLTVRGGNLWVSNIYGEDKSLCSFEPGKWYEVEMHIPAGAEITWAHGTTEEKGFPQLATTSGPCGITVRQQEQIKTFQVEGFKRSSQGYSLLVIQDKGRHKSLFSIDDIEVSCN